MEDNTLIKDTMALTNANKNTNSLNIGIDQSNESPESENDIVKEAIKLKNTVEDDKKKVKQKSKSWDYKGELEGYAGKPMLDRKNSIASLAKQAATAIGVDPAVLLSSSWIEGGNKQAIKGNQTSPLYNKAFPTDEEFEKFPVDGFAAYGIDTIGDKWDKVKKYLPADFDKRLKFYKNRSEPTKANPKGAIVTSAGFDSDQAALMAKAAMLKYEEDRVKDYAKQKNIELDDESIKYFTMVGYNRGNAFGVMDAYAKDKDKKTFISGGRSPRKDAHKNVIKRIDSLEIAQKLLNDAADVVEE